MSKKVPLKLNPTVMFAQTKLNSLNVLLDHGHLVENLCNLEHFNSRFLAIFLEAVFCRCVDVFQDALHKLVMQVVNVLPYTDPRLSFGMKARQHERLLAGEDPGDAIKGYLQQSLGFRLGLLREFAKNLSFPTTANVEAIVRVRNCIVHNNSAISSPLTDFLSEHPIKEIGSVFKEGKIELSTKATMWSLAQIKDALAQCEEHLHAEFGIPWEKVHMVSAGKMVFSDWFKKDPPESNS